MLNLTKTEGAVAISIFDAVNGFGRPLAGYLSDRYGVLSIMIATYTVQALTYLLFPVIVSSLFTLYLATALLGWGYAVTLALFPTLTSLYFGTKHMGTNYGLVFTAFGVGALTPVISSVLYDATQSYTIIFFLVGLLTVFGQVLVIYQKFKYKLA